LSSTDRLRRLVALAAVLATSLAAALVLGEAALRLVGFSFPSFSLPDDLTGSRPRPNMSGWQRNEGAAYIRINSHGLRADREYPYEKPAGIARVAVLGDSFTYAAAVPPEATFPAHLERELNGCRAFGERTVEVLNFGVSGYGTAQELLTLRHRAARYSPDLVLLAFFPGNDVRNNSKRLEAARLRPFYILREGALVLDDSFRRDPEHLDNMRIAENRAALQELRLYQLLRKLRAGEFSVRHNTPIAAAIAQGKQPASVLTETGLDENVLREPRDELWLEAWIITEKLILAAAEESRRLGARFMLATLSSGGAVHPDPSLRRKYAEHLGVPDLFYPDRRIRGFAERHGIEVVTLGPEMQRRADETRTHYHGFANAMLGFGHWNQAGHEVAGMLLARYLCATSS
jgi:hypothetical protein